MNLSKVYIDRKSDCEKIVLTREEKKLLRTVKNNPHIQLSYHQSLALYQMGLIEADSYMNASGMTVYTDKWCVSSFYYVYMAYNRRFWFVETFRSLWLPIVTSVITTLITMTLKELWPQMLSLIQQWFANSP